MKIRKMTACALLLLLCAGPGMAEITDEVAPDIAAQVDMLAVDHRLYELGYRDAACNGVLDEVTQNALKNFQRVNNLTVTGMPDTDTVAVLLSDAAVSESDYLQGRVTQREQSGVLGEGTYGSDVIRLQRTLREYGYFGGNCDGAYGEATLAAVCRFQLANGLSLTGAADGAVMLRLYDGKPASWDAFLDTCCVGAGDSGDNVRLIQRCLLYKGYFRGECTGRYGGGTRQAVMDFQTDSGLPSSGVVDRDTAQALLYDAQALMRAEEALHPGDTGEAAEKLCARLSELGYAAAEQYNQQTQLALMQFQTVNGLDVTADARAETLDVLYGSTARGYGDFAGTAGDVDASVLDRVAAEAETFLGRKMELDSDFDFVSYVYLSCGAALIDAGQLTVQEIPDMSGVQPGQIVTLAAGDKQLTGIIGTDGAWIYRSNSGYVVRRYPEMMSVDAYYLNRLTEDGQ